MTQGGSDGNKFHKLLGRALTDEAFRDALKDPNQQVEALASMDIEATEAVLGYLNAAVAAIDNLAKSETMGGGPQEVG